MLEKLKRLFSPIRGAEHTSLRTNLAERLKAYPPYVAPHIGFGKQLTESQAIENFAHFQSVMPKRLKGLSTFLRENAGIEIEPALNAPQAQGLALTDALNQWAGIEWPSLYDSRFVLNEGWVNSRRDGNDLVLSLLVDISMLLGELIVLANSDWRWGVDLDHGNLADEMLSSRRVVLVADPVGTMPYPFVEDVEAVVVSRLQQIDRDNERSLVMNPWRRLVDEGQRGAAMAFYRSNSGD